MKPRIRNKNDKKHTHTLKYCKNAGGPPQAPPTPNHTLKNETRQKAHGKHKEGIRKERKGKEGKERKERSEGKEMKGR